MNVGPLLVIATLAVCVAFAGAYVVARHLDNYSIVDVAWSYAFGPVALLYAFASPGATSRRIVLAVVVVLWSTRLATHLLRRVAQHHPVEDARYGQLRRAWSGNFPARMFRFFQLQALSIVVLSVPFLLIARNAAPFPHGLEIGALVCLVAAVVGETVADHQLATFKRDPANRHRVCARGLWRYTRHPNYFFEWLVWVSFALFALPASLGWLGVLSPLVILYLLVRVTGIPLTEAQLLRSKGDAYRRYQQSTSAFFPWPPRKL